MSIRRSTRLASNALRSNVTEVEQVVKESKPRKRSNAAEKNNGAKKRRNDNDTVQAPENWEIVYDKIKEYRQKTIAPVDTMGCERLAEDGIPDKVRKRERERERNREECEFFLDLPFYLINVNVYYRNLDSKH